MSLLTLHVALTCFMTGLIWVVQLVHYPLMKWVPPEQFEAFEKSHQRRISTIVAPAMLAEMGTAALLVYLASDRPLVIVNLALLIGIWVSTAFVQMPLHRKLEQGFDAAVLDRLVRTNWIRTALWSGRAALLIAAA